MASDKEDQLLVSDFALHKVTVHQTENGQHQAPEEMKLMTPPPSRTLQKGRNLEWIEMSYSVALGRKKSKFRTVLHGLTGKAQAQELTAIVGPTGSGKSSLLNCVAGYSFRGVRGTVLVDGAALRKSEFRGLRSHVVQGECLLPYLSVQETLQAAATLKMPSTVSAVERHRLVVQIMDELGLGDVRKVRCDRLSKTLSRKLFIAQDVIQKPPIIFLDEPTRGLDSSASADILGFLRRLADRGHTIICALHKPSAQMLSSFNQMYLLSEGHCCYEGPVGHLVEFLSSQGLHCPQYHNPVDFAMESTMGDTEVRADLETEVRRMSTVLPVEGERRIIPSAPQTDDEDEISLTEGQAPICQKFHIRNKFQYYPASRFTQFQVLILRFYLCMLRDPLFTHLRLVAHICGGILTGLLYLGVGKDRHDISNNNNFIFVNILVLTLIHLLTSVLTLPREVPIFIREQTNNWYSAAISYTARTVAEIPFQIFLPVLYGCIVYWMAGQPSTTYSFCCFLAFCVLSATVAHSLGIIVGVGFQHQHAVILGPVLLVPMMIYSGFFRPLAQVAHYLQWMMYLSFIRYGYEGMLASIYPMAADGDEEPPVVLPFNRTSGTLWQSYLALAVFFGLFRCMGYGAFKWRLYYR